MKKTFNWRLIKLCLAVSFLAAIFGAGCGKESKEEEPLITPEYSNQEPPVSSEVSSAAEPDIEKPQPVLYINPLTGGDTEVEMTQRPYAVMINNAPKALPQSGINKADIFYEVLAEGGITRILAVFGRYDVEKIGPVRSARHYFIDFSYDFDAIFVHHGRSPQADSALNSLNVENLDGMELEGRAFWRDEERLKMGGMYEHSSYISGENVLQAAADKGYRTNRQTDFPFQFYDEDARDGQSHDDIITIAFSDVQKSAFVYNSGTTLYERWQNGQPQIDENTGEQIAVKNILIQKTNIYVIPGDTEGRREVKTLGEGEGTLYTNGVTKAVKWRKEASKDPIVWTDLSGEPLKLNKGKTWICVVSEH